MSQEWVQASLAVLEAAKSKSLKATASGRFREFWREGTQVALGPHYKTQIARLILDHMCESSNVYLEGDAVCDAAFEQHRDRSIVPVRSAGLPNKSGPERGTMSFEQGTYKKWLAMNGRCSPTPYNAELCVECVLRGIDQILVTKFGHRPFLADQLRGFVGTARMALEMCVASLNVKPELRDWVRIPPKIYGEMPSGPARGLLFGSFDEKLKETIRALKTNRSVEILGPHYSGKHQLLRGVVMRHGEGFVTANGHAVSFCALSLHEMTGTEAIIHIRDFYAELLGIGRGGENVHDCLAEIASYARQIPILVIIAGLDMIDRDEVVRAMHQDLIGEMISRIAGGHPETRILVSRSIEDHEILPGRRGGRGAIRSHKAFSFDVTIPLNQSGVPARNYEYRALLQSAAALVRTADQMPSEEKLGDLRRSDEDLRTNIVSVESHEQLAHHVVRSLSPQAVRALGLVALSRVGTTPKLLHQLVAALAGHGDVDGCWDFDPVAVLDRLPDEVVRKPAQKQNVGPSSYHVERSLVDPLLRVWRDEEKEQFYQGCWVIARAHAADALAMRVRSGPDVSAGRDVQVLMLLLACVDTQDVTLRCEGPIPLERQILPPLDLSNAVMPSGSKILRFAHHALFENDLFVSARSRAPAMDDARLRLATAFSFFCNRTPWRAVSTRDNPDSWRLNDRRTIWTRLDHTARLRLLLFAASAADRLNLWRLIPAFTRAAEAVADELVPEGAAGHKAAIQFLSKEQSRLLARLQRYEIDIAISRGRMISSNRRSVSGEARLQRGRGLAEVETIIDLLVAEAPDTQKGRSIKARLYARKAEVRHLRGHHVAAHWCFDRAFRSGSAVKGSPYRPIVLPDGRSQHMFTRLLIELGRARLFGKDNSSFVYFGDGLGLAMLRRSDARPLPLVKAQIMVENAIRNLASGSSNDALGVKIDLSRLAALRLEYTHALDNLVQARQHTRAPGASRDIVLEYMSLWARTLCDAAAFVMATGALENSDEGRSYLPEVERLAAWTGLPAYTPGASIKPFASTVSEALCDQAHEALETLRELASGPDNFGTRYTIFADYLDVWIAVVRSRHTVRGKTETERRRIVAEQLETAGRRLTAVMKDMLAIDYLMAHREVGLLVRGLEAARGASMPRIMVEIPEGFPTFAWPPKSPLLTMDMGLSEELHA